MSTPEWVERALGRASDPQTVLIELDQLRRRGLVLVTGGLGSLGTAIGDLFDQHGVEFVLTDEREMDVTDPVQVEQVMRVFQPRVVLHLAGAKHAPEGEVDPLHPARVHIDGTRNVLEHAPVGARVVTASTCKACDPETAYGASKLLAERLTLNAGHTVARFHNVAETSGNVFQLWQKQDGAIPVAACERFFITLAEATSLLLYAACAPAGRYCFDPGERHDMRRVADRLYPTRAKTEIGARRGDRIAEPLHARSETVVPHSRRILRVESPHDPITKALEVAA